MIKKLVANSLLLAVLFGLLALPIGSIGLTDLKSSDVLSEQDVRLEQPAPKPYFPTEPVTESTTTFENSR